MNLIMVLLVAVIGAFIGGALAALLRRGPDVGKAIKDEAERLERVLRDEAAQTRRDAPELPRGPRAELTATLTQFAQQLPQQQEGMLAILADTHKQPDDNPHKTGPAPAQQPERRRAPGGERVVKEV